MPWGLRITDEDSLRAEARENPRSTRWVTQRGVVRKKQGGGGGGEKKGAVDGGRDEDVRVQEKRARERAREG